MYRINYCEFSHHVRFNSQPVFNGFRQSSYEKTNTSLYFGLSLSPHVGTHVTRTGSYTAHGVSFSFGGWSLTEGSVGCGSAECWWCIFPRGELRVYTLGYRCWTDLATLKSPLGTDKVKQSVDISRNVFKWKWHSLEIFTRVYITSLTRKLFVRLFLELSSLCMEMKLSVTHTGSTTCR
jgi:hypothetical protein